MKPTSRIFTILSFIALTTSAAIPTAAAQESPAVYVVAAGDTLSKIAREHGTTVQALMQMNNLTSDRLAIGQKLNLPLSEIAHAETPVPQLADVSPASGSDVGVRPPDIADSRNMTVTADVLNVRQTPSLDGTILGKLPFGTVVQILEHGAEWSKIAYGSTEAYVYTTYLSDTAATAPSASLPVFSDDTRGADRLQAIVQPLLKTPYVYGGTTPDGFDCSGFTAYVLQQLGVTLPRTSEEQFAGGQAVPLEQAVPGDLLFYDSLNKGRVSHVALYMGNGLIVHANGTDVRYEKVENMHKLYPFYGVKRYLIQ
jgi:cell wall-associated NlpC family hydrolase